MAPAVESLPRLWIKICANTCAEDALAAVQLGADAVGFVFAPSKRQVDARQVRAIVAELPPDVERVGVFSDWSAEQIAAAAETAQLTSVQLHGGFNPELSARLLQLLPGIRLIQTAHWVVGEDDTSALQVATALGRLAAFAPGSRVLVDAKAGGSSGGTGMAFNWRQAAAVLREPRGVEVVLAGGLRPENVAEAIQTVQPQGVDVASGVESTPGRKDLLRLRDFVAKARQAHSLLAARRV